MLGAGSQARRLTTLEQPSKPTDKPGGALLLPPILPPDAWEELAVKSQERLAQLTREGVA